MSDELKPVSGPELVALWEKAFPRLVKDKAFTYDERRYLITLINLALKQCMDLAEQEVLKVAEKLAQQKMKEV